MAWSVINPLDIDAKSPVKDSLLTQVKDDLDYLKSAVTDGAAASQGITTSTVAVKGAGTALVVDHEADIGKDLLISGVLTTGVIFTGEQLLSIMEF